jgi:hypothetical protein
MDVPMSTHGHSKGAVSRYAAFVISTVLDSLSRSQAPCVS